VKNTYTFSCIQTLFNTKEYKCNECGKILVQNKHLGKHQRVCNEKITDGMSVKSYFIENEVFHMWWIMTVIQVLMRLRHEDHKFKSSLDKKRF
jgi:DNA-directed RNA polymerase subunit RPC12/RpoP